MQELVWHGVEDNGRVYGIVFEPDAEFMPIRESVGYKCRNCGHVMKNWDKATIMEHGDWIETAKSSEPYLHSFHLSPLYNPPGMFSWEDMVTAWSQCWDIKNNRIKDKEKYRVFRNTKQGLPFKESGEQIRYEKAMMHRRYGFVRGKVPNDLAAKDTGSAVLIIVASVDVQKRNVFVDVKGYSMNGAIWTIDFFSIDGDVEDFGGPWDALGAYFENTTLAYHINTTKLKDRISRSLNSLQWDEGNAQPAWYPNFPDDYFRMFEAENKVDEYDRKTNKYLRTIRKQKPGADNHAFDSFVYNLAALEIFADDICRIDLNLGCLDWRSFWDFAKEPVFYWVE
jgi:phage terminase large subunit GpA-like protein